MLRKKTCSVIVVFFMLITLIGPFGSASVVKAEAGNYTGDVLKLVVVNDGNSGNHYLYKSFSNTSYTFQAGDYIEYDVKVDKCLGGAGGIDIFTTDSLNFRDTAGWVDQNGIGGHPGNDISIYAFNAWYHRKLAVPDSRIGKTASKWVVAGENDFQTINTYAAYYDNIVVTDGNGTVKKVIYKNASDANLDTTELSSYISSSSMKTVVFNHSKEDMEDVLRLAVTNDGTSGNHYLYQKFSDTPYTFQTGDYIEYDVKIENYVSGAGGIEIYNTDSTYFRDTAGWADQNGIGGHPESDISAYAYNSWYHRKLAVPASMISKTAAKWMVVCENNTPNEVCIANYDNIVVTDGNGTVKKTVYKSAVDANLNITEISAYTSAVAMTSIIPTNIAAGVYRESSGYIAGAESKYALDGDIGGYWVSTAASPNWLKIDLGKVYNIKRWVVWHASSLGDLPVYNTKDYKLQVSIDGTNFTDIDSVEGNTKGITDRNIDATARYVRLYITQGTQDGSDRYVRIREFELYASSESYFSLFKPVTASAFQSGGEPFNAVNGKFDNYWLSFAPSPNWLRVDLGRVYKIKRWVVRHASSGGDLPVYNTKDFKLQVSNDGVNFTDVDTVVGNTAGITDRNVNATGRYARLYITRGTQDGSDGYVRIREFEIYGDVYGVDVSVSTDKTASASSTDTGTQPGYAVDDNLNSQWRSSGTGTQWLTVDLGQTHVIDRWVVKHAGANWETTVNNTKDFKLQVSSDGINFTDVDTVAGNTERITDRKVYNATGRYVRLYITAGTQTGGDGKARINEFKVYGVPMSSAPNPRVIATTYPTDDIVIASYLVTDSPYSADNTGVNDATLAIQKALDDCYAAGGGVVFMPAGKYKITDTISIPNHVTLRGDWQDPDVGTDYGTVLIANVSSTNLDLPGLIRLGGSSGLKGVTIYYPNQSGTNPIPYPYTIEIPGRAYGEEGYMHQTIENVTLLNSYKGISTYRSNSDWMKSAGEENYIKNVKGTALKQAIRLYNTADVGRCINVKFNNSYWANAPTGYNPQSRATLDSWTRANGTGFEVADVEFDQFYNMSFYDYNIGMIVKQGPRAEPSATMFGFDIQNSNIALRVDWINQQLGLNISNSIFKANQGANPVAVQINSSNGGPVTFNTCTIGGGAFNAVQLNNNSIASFFNCTFDDWSGTYAVTANNGTLIIEGSTFTPALSSTKKGVSLSGSLVSAVLLGNTINGASYFLDNSSSGDVKRQDTGYSFESHGVTGHTIKTILPKPPNNNLYNVKASYGAKGDGITDDTAAIQNALTAAGNAGGGTVYLPAGHYRVNTHLTVLANVELRGSDDVPHKGDSMGSVLFVYEGRGTSTPDTDTAFITLNGSNAGVRGLTIYYPEQPNSTSSSSPYVAYPWSIRGNASGVYSINVNFVNSYKALDFGYGSNQTNNHYISYVNGTALRNAIAVGNSTEGWLEDSLFNGTYWCRTTLPNRISEAKAFDYLFPYMKSNQTAYWIGNAQNEHMLNDFAYGTNKCYNYSVQGSSGAAATAINCSADGAYSSIVIDGTSTTGVKMVNVHASVNDLGPVIRINGGTAKIFNVSSAPDSNNAQQAIYITGGNSVLQGIYNTSGPCQVTAGTTKWNGVVINYPGGSGAQLTISAGVTGSDFSGCAGKDTVSFVNNAGSGATLSNNIRK